LQLLQAFVYKYYAKRNRRFFAPETGALLPAAAAALASVVVDVVGR